MKKQSLLLLLTNLLFVAACSGTKLIAPSQTDVDRGKDNFPGLSLEQMQLGQQVYAANCNACHPYKKVTSYSATEWARIVPEMAGKANRKLGPNTINASQEQALLRYVAVMASH